MRGLYSAVTYTHHLAQDSNSIITVLLFDSNNTTLYYTCYNTYYKLIWLLTAVYILPFVVVAVKKLILLSLSF